MSDNTNKNSIAKNYYEGGNSSLTDAEWDALYEDETVGYTPDDGVRHSFPMLSLKKTFDEDELGSWIASHEGQEVIHSPKLDGSAVSVLYDKGEFVRATTRGNGQVGVDISNKMRFLVPEKINFAKKVQIDGEVVAPITIPNARNYAAGSRNIKLLRAFIPRCNELRFIAYDLRPHGFIESWTVLLSWLESLGFSTVHSVDASQYPTDGEVHRLDNIEYWSNQVLLLITLEGHLPSKFKKKA